MATRSQINAQNSFLYAMIEFADAEIKQWKASDSIGAEKTMWLWVDRRTSLIDALEPFTA